MGTTPHVRWSVVEESLDEAEFLWAKRERALDSHCQDLSTVWTWTEERLLGALDGLLCAGEDLIEPLLVPAIEEGPSARASAATFVLASMASDTALAKISRALQTVPLERLSSLRTALELGSSLVLLERLSRALGKPSGPALALLTDVRTFLGGAPDPDLGKLFLSADPVVQAAAIRAARNAPLAVATTWAEVALAVPQHEVRVEAVETGLIAGLPSAWSTCLEMLGLRTIGFSRLSIAAAALGGQHEHQMIGAALAAPECRRDALFALGFAGTPAAADICLKAMENESCAKIAGESFCAITGLDLEIEKLALPEAEPPEESVAVEQEDQNADLVPSCDDELPMPDAAGVARWWNANRKRFIADQRYIAGRPASLSVLHERLAKGPMRRCHGLAFELAVRTGGTQQIRTRAFTKTQWAQLDAAAAALGQGAKPRWPAAPSRHSV